MNEGLWSQIGPSWPGVSAAAFVTVPPVGTSRGSQSSVSLSDERVLPGGTWAGTEFSSAGQCKR